MALPLCSQSLNLLIYLALLVFAFATIVTSENGGILKGLMPVTVEGNDDVILRGVPEFTGVADAPENLHEIPLSADHQDVRQICQIILLTGRVGFNSPMNTDYTLRFDQGIPFYRSAQRVRVRDGVFSYLYIYWKNNAWNLGEVLGSISIMAYSLTEGLYEGAASLWFVYDGHSFKCDYNVEAHCYVENRNKVHELNAKAAFGDFKRAYNRRYKSKEEELKRMDCFRLNLERIEELREVDQASHGINEFADLCPNEFKAQRFGLDVNQSSEAHNRSVELDARALKELASTPIPTSFDWRKKGAVSPVKNQGHCGSCWAFSAVAAMEGAWVLAGHSLTKFSEGQLVQCAKSAGYGCQGGWMDAAIEWVVKNHGIASEKAYPYTSSNGRTGECNKNLSAKPIAKFRGVLKFKADEQLLAAFLMKHGPLFIGVDASDWQTYIGGTKTLCGGANLNHGVALVGFGPGYWIVRNSWGSTWGEGGYIRLKRGVNCDGILSYVGAAQV